MAETSREQAKVLGLQRPNLWLSEAIVTAAKAKENKELRKDSPIPDEALLIEVTNQGSMRALRITVSAEWLTGPMGADAMPPSLPRGRMAASFDELDGTACAAWAKEDLEPGQEACLWFSPPTGQSWWKPFASGGSVLITWQDSSGFQSPKRHEVFLGEDGKWHVD